MMLRRLVRITLLSLALAAPWLSAKADTAIQTATAHCDPKASQFNVTFSDIWNPPVSSTLGVSVMKPQLSNQKVISFNAVHHTVLIRDAA